MAQNRVDWQSGFWLRKLTLCLPYCPCIAPLAGRALNCNLPVNMKLSTTFFLFLELLEHWQREKESPNPDPQSHGGNKRDEHRINWAAAE